MAVKQKSAEWVDMGGRTAVYVPDRLRISCPRCDQDLCGATSLAFFNDDGKLKVGIRCDDCGEMFPDANVEMG